MRAVILRYSSKSCHGACRYLLSIAGKRIAVLFVLAIARTAISNRLARLQASVAAAHRRGKCPLLRFSLAGLLFI